MPIGLEQWRMQIGALEAQRYRYLSRAARKAARGGRVRVGRISGGCLVGIVLCVTLLCLATSFSMRLLLAGDVERNPGPLPDEILSSVDNTELTVDDLRAVYKEVHTLAGRWRAMCLSLGLSDSEVEITAATYPTNPHDCFREVILKWLKKTYNFQRYGPPTWKMLVEAVADPAGGNNTALAEKIARAHQAAATSPPTPSGPQAAVDSPGNITTPAQQQQQPDPRKTHYLSAKFAETFDNITDVLDKSVCVRDLKKFLNHYSHPLYPEQRYIDPKEYKRARTTAKVLEALFPKFINYMTHFLLEDIVNRFRCDEARILLQEYMGQLHDSRRRKLSTFPDPITDEEAEQFAGVKKLKVACKEDFEPATIQYMEEKKVALETATGIHKAFITYSSQDPGSVILYFLIPEVVCHVFHDLGEEDLTILADSGVTRLEIDEFVIEDIQSYTTQKTSTTEVEYSSEDTKRGGLEYYLKERMTEIGSDKHSHFLKMLKSVPSSELRQQCSKRFLVHFAKNLKEWKKLAPYFGINEWHYEELEERYPDKRDQNYQALLCWRRMEVDTATYYNLLETLLLHGDIEEVEALLRRMGPDPAVLHLSESLKQKYLDYDSWHAWRDVPNLMEFDQRLGELTEDAPRMLKQLIYSDCPKSVDQYPSLVTPVSPKSLINSIASRKRPVFLIKGPPIGSSHLLGKVCQYWAKGFGLRRFTLVLWINLTCWNTRIDSLEGLLTQGISGGIVKGVCSWIQTRNGKNVLFLLDGWYLNVEQTSILHKLVSRQYLTNSTVVVTSTFTPKPMPIFQYMHIQYEGLTRTQISKQIIRYHELNPTRAEELLQYLASNPDMQLLSHTPVNLYAILFVSQSISPSDHDFPHTKTQFFMTLTVLLLQQTFPEHQLRPHLSSLHTAYSEGQLPPPVHTFLEKLSQFAMYMCGLEDYHHVLIDQLLHERPTDFTFLQYLNKSPFASKKLVRFAFPGLRDFLAALLIHHLPGQLGRTEAMQEKLMKKNTFPWPFYAGLCKYEHLSVLSSLLEKHCGNDIKKLASCAYEANVIVNIPNTIRGLILTVADIHHIIAASQNIREMIFEECCLETDASVQLSKLHRYFHPQLSATGYSEHHLQFRECVFSEEGLGYLSVTTVEEIRLSVKLSVKQLQSFVSGLRKHLGPRSWSLDLDSCQIGDEGATALSKALRVNHTLRTLNLAHTNIHDSGGRALAEGLCHNNSLQELDLSFNAIGVEGATALSEALRVNHTLRTLNLARNKIHVSGARALAEGLCHNNSLQELNLSYNGIGDEGATALSEALRVNHTLRTLNLVDNKIRDSGARALAGLCHNNSLQELDLSRNRIGDGGATALSEALRMNHTLRTLNLAWNGIHDSGARALAEGLCHNNSLQELDLSLNGIRDKGATALSEALRVNHTLRTLNLAGNKIHASGGRALTEVLCHNNSLQELDLSHNEIGDEGAAALSDALRVNHTLRTLNLARNTIQVSGARALAEGLCHNNSLQGLGLSLNVIGDEGATALSEALRVNHTLKTLKLAGNNIHASGGRALTEVLCHNNSLQELDLTYNWIGDGGATALSEALRVNHTLRTLKLADSKIYDSGARALAEVLYHNNSLQELDLSDNRIGYEGTTALSEALRVNRTLRTLKLSAQLFLDPDDEDHPIWSEHKGRVI